MKKVFVDYRISETEKNSLTKLGLEPIVVPPSKVLYEAVCGHPDMLMHIIDQNTIVVHRDIDTEFVDQLKARNINVLLSDASIQSSYPFDIALNAVNHGNLFVHNLKYTDKLLLELVKEKKLKNAKQGYAKCSTAIVNDSAVMTSDKRIANAFVEEGLDVLLLPPGDIVLPGLNYGFIGGCCGLLEKGLLAFFGNLESYAYKNEVYDFLKAHKVEPMFLSDGKLIDRGSILSI